MRLVRAIAVLILLATRVNAADPSGETARFTTVDIIIDAGTDALAAYQIEIIADGDAQIIGVEGGDHPAFNPPPNYDRAALHGERIILAAFSTSTDLPTSRIRVAILHMRESGTVTYRTRLLAAARADGTRFTPVVSTIPGGH